MSKAEQHGHLVQRRGEQEQPPAIVDPKIFKMACQKLGSSPSFSGGIPIDSRSSRRHLRFGAWAGAMFGCVHFGAWVLVPLQGVAARSVVRIGHVLIFELL